MSNVISLRESPGIRLLEEHTYRVSVDGVTYELPQWLVGKALVAELRDGQPTEDALEWRNTLEDMRREQNRTDRVAGVYTRAL